MEEATNENRTHPLPPIVPPALVDETSRTDIVTTKPDTGASDSTDGHYNRDRKRDNDDQYMRSHSRDVYDAEYERSDKHRKNRKYDREKKHHYHRKSDRDRSDHHRSHRDRYRYRDDERESSRDSSKYRDSYKSKSDRDYSKSSGTKELNFGSSGYTSSAAASYDQAYSYQSMTSSYGSQPSLPPQSSTLTDYSYSSVPVLPPATTTWNHQHPWQSIAPIPPEDQWSSRPIIPPPPATNHADEDWDNADNAEVDVTKTNVTKKHAQPMERDDEKTTKRTDDEDQSTIDLDTRIAMMIKDKQFGAAPPFLQMDDSDTELDHNEEGEIRNDEKKNHRSKGRRTQRTNSKSSHSSKSSDASKKRLKQNRLRTQVRRQFSQLSLLIPLSFTSPRTKLIFIYIFLQVKRLVGDDASDISSSDDDILLRKNDSPPGNVLLASKDDDKMSWSSLSSTEEKDMDPPPLPPIPHQPPLPQEPPPPPPSSKSHAMAIHSGSNYLYPPGTQGYYYPTPAYNPYQPSHQYMVPHSPYMQTYVPGFPLIPHNNYMAPIMYSPKKTEKITNDDHYESTITTVINQVTAELKMILKKDFNKKMIENTAYKKFETWWDDNEQNKNKDSAAVQTDSTTNKSKVPDINQLLNNNLDHLDSYSGLTLGLRAQIPKLPSFRRIRKVASPKPKVKQQSICNDDDDDWDKDNDSDIEDMVKASDSEAENDTHPSTKISFNDKKVKSTSNEFKDRKRKGSISSISSSSDDESSSDSDSSSNVSSSDGDDTNKPDVSAKNKRGKETQIYSDSESNASVTVERKQATKVPSRRKAGIYSDSSDDENAKTNKLNKPPTPEVKQRSVVSVEKVQSLPDVQDDGASQSPKPPRTPGRETPPSKKSAYDYDRIYSDSDEEREYQEKRRRNTEYMAQIEREFMEERMREELEKSKKLKQSTTIDEEYDTLPDKAPSPGDPITPSLSKLPPTPGSRLSQTDPISKYMLQHDAQEKLSGTTTSLVAEQSTSKANGAQISNSLQHTSAFIESTRPIKFSPSSSDGGSSQTSQASQVAMEHCYSLPPSASPHIDASTSQPPSFTNQKQSKPDQNHHLVDHDHGYTMNNISDDKTISAAPVQIQKQGPGRPKKDSAVARLKKAEKAAALAEAAEAKKRASQPFVPEERYADRNINDEVILLYEFLTKGIDAEDIEYLRQSYEYMLQDDYNSNWLNATHWMEHCTTASQPATRKRKRDSDAKKHASGSARTEGFYKQDIKDKARFKYHHAKLNAGETAVVDIHSKLVSKMQGASREARSNQRRLLTAFGASTESELLKFNQLKFRKKQLKFAKSAIHDWGLFAMEPIAADEMVIEYVGQMIRPVVADLRETKYEAIGIGSSYLFRIDLETIIDATKCGNLARFINHSCNVSCFFFKFFFVVL